MKDFKVLREDRGYIISAYNKEPKERTVEKEFLEAHIEALGAEKCFNKAKKYKYLPMLEALYEKFGDITPHVSLQARQELAQEADEKSRAFIFSNPGMKAFAGSSRSQKPVVRAKAPLNEWTSDEQRKESMYADFSGEEEEAVEDLFCWNRMQVMIQRWGAQRSLKNALKEQNASLLLAVLNKFDISPFVDQATKEHLADIARYDTVDAILSNKAMKDMVIRTFTAAYTHEKFEVVRTILKNFKNQLPESEVNTPAFKKFVEESKDSELRALLSDKQGFKSVEPIQDRALADLPPPRPIEVERKAPEVVSEIPQAQPPQFLPPARIVSRRLPRVLPQPEPKPVPQVQPQLRSQPPQLESQAPQLRSQPKPQSESEARGSFYSFLPSFANFISGWFSSSTPPAPSQTIAGASRARQTQVEAGEKRLREETDANPEREHKRFKKQ
ncbi:MAG: hypothetical protein ACHQJ6_05855 [Candidatus Berkiellales bacterium]